jgi:hypothetical protein
MWIVQTIVQYIGSKLATREQFFSRYQVVTRNSMHARLWHLLTVGIAKESRCLESEETGLPSRPTGPQGFRANRSISIIQSKLSLPYRQGRQRTGTRVAQTWSLTDTAFPDP